MQLLEESEAQGEQAPVEEEPMPSKEELLKELMAEEENGVLTGHQAAALEFQMMMTHFEALAADYERREAEEAAQKKVAEEGAS
jgi:hypothetical protein